MHLLQFGGNGQLGRQLAGVTGAHGIRVTFVSKRQADNTNPIQLLDAFTAIRPDIVVNAAAYTKVDLAEAETTGAWRSNGEGQAILAGASRLDSSRFAAVFGLGAMPWEDRGPPIVPPVLQQVGNAP